MTPTVTADAKDSTTRLAAEGASSARVLDLTGLSGAAQAVAWCT